MSMATAAGLGAQPTFFTVVATGQIESAHLPNHNHDLYCKFSYANGPDWIVLSGLEQGLTQISSPPPPQAFTSAAAPAIHWNFPLSIAWKSTNPHGWPSLVLSVYGLDAWGQDGIRGYGLGRIPMIEGRHVLNVPVFVPLASSYLNGFISWLVGREPEFLDAKFVSQSVGREVTRVQSQGMVRVCVDIVLKDLDKCGFQGQQSPT